MIALASAADAGDHPAGVLVVLVGAVVYLVRLFRSLREPLSPADEVIP